MNADEFRAVLREVIRDEIGIGDAELGSRWDGGEVILKPGKEGTAEKRVPIDAFFHKVVMIRDKLRVLEQRINAHAKLTDEEKIQMQQYVTGCYGTLTTFNVLFANARGRDSQGAKGDKDDELARGSAGASTAAGGLACLGVALSLCSPGASTRRTTWSSANRSAPTA